MRRNTLIILGLVVVLMMGCSENAQGPVKRSWGRMKGLDKMVGNMNDASYSTVRDLKPRLNALGVPVPISSFEGKFLWAEYDASWCPTCSKQTPQTQQAKRQLGGDVVFINILTGKSQAYDDHATIDTAKQWTNRYGLDPAHVFAAELWYKTIPEHRFFSPQGHTLFVHVGYLSSQEIKEVIDFYKPAWEHWAQTGEKADWMTFR